MQDKPEDKAKFRREYLKLHSKTLMGGLKCIELPFRFIS